MKTNFFIIISFLSITFIFCSIVCPIQYKCLNETDPLCFKETTKESVIIREERKCPKGQYCKKKSETESECSTNERNLFPGEACSSNNECASNKCGNLTCTGLSEKSECTSNAAQVTLTVSTQLDVSKEYALNILPYQLEQH